MNLTKILVGFLTMILVFVNISANPLQINVLSSDAEWIQKPAIDSLASSQHSAIGAQTTIVILVEFPDAIHNVSRGEIHRRVFTEMNVYYQEISYNQTWVTGETVSRWYSLAANFSSHNVTQWDSPSEEFERIITNATSLVDYEVDFRTYEHLFIVCARNSTSKVWAHELSGLRIETNDGITVDKAVVVSEDDSTGTFAHEFGHSLGLPDLYSYELQRAGKRSDVYAGLWDIMSVGSLVHMSAYCKIRLGWIPLERVRKIFTDENATLIINPIEISTQGVHVIQISLTSETYYLVEVRQTIGCDEVLPDRGVLISYVNETVAMSEMGKGPVRVQDANPNTSTLDDSTFDIRHKKNPVFMDTTRNLAIIVLSEIDRSFAIQVTTVENGAMAADAATTINDARTKINEAKESVLKSEEAKMLLQYAENKTDFALQTFSQSDFESAKNYALDAIGLVYGAYSSEQAYEQQLAPEIDWTIVSTIVMMIATLVMAIFTGLTWLILHRQDKMQNDPDLRIHCYPLHEVPSTVGTFKGLELEVRAVLVNPGRVPAIVTEISEVVMDRTTNQGIDARKFFSLPEERPPKIYISQLPWVIEGGGFAVYNKNFCLPAEYKKKELYIGLRFDYFVTKKQKTIEVSEIVWKATNK